MQLHLSLPLPCGSSEKRSAQPWDTDSLARRHVQRKGLLAKAISLPASLIAVGSPSHKLKEFCTPQPPSEKLGYRAWLWPKLVAPSWPNTVGRRRRDERVRVRRLRSQGEKASFLAAWGPSELLADPWTPTPLALIEERLPLQQLMSGCGPVSNWRFPAVWPLSRQRILLRLEGGAHTGQG